jgi:Fe-S-cluster containining protein
MGEAINSIIKSVPNILEFLISIRETIKKIKDGTYKKETYVSIFSENGEIKTERIGVSRKLNSDKKKIKCKITFYENEKLTINYTLKGKYFNKILTGEYISEDKTERGVINLKSISNGEILSGFCSFYSVTDNVDGNIKTSPCVWVKEQKNDSNNLARVINGIFPFCEGCKTKNCCCKSISVDMPILTEREKSNIYNKSENTKSRKKFCTQFNRSSVYQIKKSKNDTCFFFNDTGINDSARLNCLIYEYRPADCRIFPFGVRLDKKENYQIGYYAGICKNIPLGNDNEMRKYLYILRPYFFSCLRYLHLITNSPLCSKMKNTSFKEMESLEEFLSL